MVAAADADRHPVRARSADVAIDNADQDRGRRRPVSWRDDGVGEARLVRGGRHRRRERGQQQGGGGDCPEPPGHLCCRTTIPDAQGSASRPGRRPMPARGCRPGRGRAMVRGSGSKPPSGRPREWPVVPRQRALDGAVRSGPADGPTAAGAWPGIVMAPGGGRPYAPPDGSHRLVPPRRTDRLAADRDAPRCGARRNGCHPRGPDHPDAVRRAGDARAALPDPPRRPPCSSGPWRSRPGAACWCRVPAGWPPL